MWGASSLSNRLQSNVNKTQYPIPNPNSLQDYNILYQTPIKQFEYQQNNNNNNFQATPFRFDFNHYFGNLWSAGKMPNNQILQAQMFLSPTQLNKDNLPLNKKSIAESYKLTPISQLKYSNSSNNSSNNSNNNNNNNIINNKGINNNINIAQNNNIANNNFINSNMNNFNNQNYFNGYKNGNINNTNNKNANDLTKKNLNELFNNAKNETSLYDKEKMKYINNYNNFNNCNIINNINHFTNNNSNNHYIAERKRFNRNCNLQISRQFIFSSPLCTTKPKKIFECSGSTVASISSNKNTNNKNRRFRKNNEQIVLLKKFYNEHKHWSKNQIKEISQKIGLKENKVYKWLWDQRNKEIKATKFVVKKDGNKNSENDKDGNENNEDENDE